VGVDIALPIIRRDFEDNRKNRNCFLSDDGRFIYHVGIIDYLQDFNFDKVIENKYKSYISDGQSISAVHPRLYCERFFDFMQSQVIIN
jgi:1-phosphatidylinositol-4-phosphate 5-kinase